MSVYLCHIEAIVRDHFFLQISSLYAVKKGNKKTNLSSN